MNGDGRGLPPTSEALNAAGMSWTSLYDAAPVQHGEMMSSAGPSTSNISNSLPALPRPKKRQSTVSRGSSDDEGDDDRKRPKAALSCSECKRRKIKCDRKKPCAACLKRGDPQGCSWDAAKIEPDRQPFALVTDLKRLADRVSTIEKWLHTLPPELRASAPMPVPFMTTFDLLDSQKEEIMSGQTVLPAVASKGRASGSKDKDKVKDKEDDLIGVMEEAARHLETSAFSAAAYVASPQDASSSKSGFKHRYIDQHHPAIAMDLGARGIDQHREPNETGTTILSPRPLNQTDEFPIGLAYPEHRAHLPGVDPQVSLEESINLRNKSFLKLCSLLPSQPLSDLIVSSYFSERGWIFNFIYEPSFRAEIRQYWTLRERGRLLEIDPSWLALYSLILATAVDSVPEQRKKPFMDLGEKPGDKAALWIACGQRFLEVGDCVNVPAMRTIQMTVLECQLVNFIFVRQSNSQVLIKLATAVRMAQLLGLHKLGSHSDTMPPLEDPSLPPGKNSVKREIGLRCWAALTFIDWITATSRTGTYCVNPAHVTSAHPSNLNENELSTTDWRIPYHSPSELTDSAFEWVRMDLAGVAREAFDQLLSSSGSLEYETILDIDSKFRGTLDRVPNSWKDLQTLAKVTNVKLRTLGHVTHQTIHSRIMRLHRPFMGRGYKGGRFRISTEKCLASAQQVIRHHSEIRDYSSTLWFCFSHSLGSAICLFADLFHSIDVGCSEPELDRKKQLIDVAIDIFAYGSKYAAPWIRPMVIRSSGILNRLLAAVEDRRMSRAARALIGGQVKENEEQSFAQILQDVTLKMATPVGSPDHVEEEHPKRRPQTPHAKQTRTAPSTSFGEVNSQFSASDAQFFADLGIVVNPSNSQAPDMLHNFWIPPSTNGPAGESGTPSDATPTDILNINWASFMPATNGQTQAATDPSSTAAAAYLDQLGSW